MSETTTNGSPVEAAVSAAKAETTLADVPGAEKEERVEAGAPPANESVVEAPKESENVEAAVVSTAEPNKQALETSASTTEETEIGGS